MDSVNETPEGRKYLYDEIVEKIRAMIDSGEVRAGDRLPPERTLARVFKVSRNSIRQAIQALSEKGILESRRGDGTYVSTTDRAALEAAFAAAIRLQKDTLHDIMEFRQLLEPRIAALAAGRITESELDRLKIIVCDQERKGLSGEDDADLDAAFHLELAKACRNGVILQFVNFVTGILNESRSEFLQSPERHRLSVVGHLKLIDALESRDGERAAKAMREHLRSVEEVVFGPDNQGGDGGADNTR